MLSKNYKKNIPRTQLNENKNVDEIFSCYILNLKIYLNEVEQLFY